jgi:hypothetical protein
MVRRGAGWPVGLLLLDPPAISVPSESSPKSLSPACGGVDVNADAECSARLRRSCVCENALLPWLLSCPAAQNRSRCVGGRGRGLWWTGLWWWRVTKRPRGRSRWVWGALTILRTGSILVSGRRALLRRRRPSRQRAERGAGRGESVRAKKGTRSAGAGDRASA